MFAAIEACTAADIGIKRVKEGITFWVRKVNNLTVGGKQVYFFDGRYVSDSKFVQCAPQLLIVRSGCLVHRLLFATNTPLTTRARLLSSTETPGNHLFAGFDYVHFGEDRGALHQCVWKRLIPVQDMLGLSPME